jgi:galactose mutarotase-like enzyme
MRTEFQNQSVVVLQSSVSRVLVAPEFGARLLSWEVAGEPVIYWPESADWSSAASIAHTRGGNPILFPFLGRHYVDGILGRWRNADGVVRELPMHGFAREMAFEVVEASAEVLRMRLQANDATRAMYPFEFTFDVAYRLEESTLEATFETANHGDRALPYYAGHHFYFVVPHDERAHRHIELPCRTWGHQNSDGSVVFEPAQNTNTTLADNALIDRFQLDFFEPRVRLQNERTARGVAIGWDAEYSGLWRYVTTWTQAPDSDFFCVEPWLGLPNAIHHGHGLRWIKPGEKEVATCHISHQHGYRVSD